MKLKIQFSIVIFQLIHVAVFGQFEHQVDSISSLSNSLSRTRAFIGTMEELTLSREDELVFLKTFERLAVKLNDKSLSKHIAFARDQSNLRRTATEAEQLKIMLMKTQEYLQQEDFLFAGYCYHFLAQHFFKTKVYDQAFEQYFTAFELFKSEGFENVPTSSKFLHDMALGHYFFREYKEVVKLMWIAQKLPPINGNHHIQRYNNLGISYAKMGVRDSAIYYFELTKKTSEKYGSTTWQAITLENIGDVFFKDRNFDAAFLNYSKGNEVLKNHWFDPIRISTHIKMAKVYAQLDSISLLDQHLREIESSLKALNVEFHYGDQQQSQGLMKSYYEVKTAYLVKMKRFEEALYYKDSLMLMEHYLDSVYDAATTLLPSYKISLEKKESEILTHQKAKSRQGILYRLLILIVVLIGAVVLFAMRKSIQRRKRQSRKFLAQKRISMQKERNAQRELEIAQNEINRFVNKVSKQSAIISQFEDRLVATSAEAERKSLQGDLEALKKSKILTDDDWFSFQFTFDKVFPTFKSTLKYKFATVTPSEMRYLMLVHLNFEHKEMARMLGVSDTAIRVTWNRLRKKLNGSLEDTPTLLLHRILN